MILEKTRSHRLLLREEQGNASLVVILGIVMASMITTYSLVSLMLAIKKYSDQAALIQTLKTIRYNILISSLNGDAWANTVNDANSKNDEMACLRAGTSCSSANIVPVPPVGPPYQFALYDSSGSGTYVFDSTDAFTDVQLDGTKNGFTRDGAPCNTFNIAGNNNCPIRYTLTWKPICPPNPTPCINPNIRIRGDLLFRPAPGSNLDVPINTQKYGINFVRGLGDRFDPIIIQYITAGNTGEGTCATNPSWTRRKLNTEITDEGNDVTVDPVANSFTMRPGTYYCTVEAPAFKTGSTRVRLRSIAGTGFTYYSQPSVSSTSFPSQVTVYQSAFINLFMMTEIVVEQSCDASYSNFDLGVPTKDHLGTYTNTILTTVTCYRTS